MVSEKKINLFCSNNKVDGFHGIDIKEGTNVDTVMDLNKYPWDIEDNSIEEIISLHYVQKVDDIIKFMQEIYRILKPGGSIKIIAPYYTSMIASQDPTHKRLISESTFIYFNKNWREVNKVEDYKCDFDFVYGYEFTPDWVNRSQEAKAFAVKHYNNVVNAIHITLTKR